MRFRPPDEAKAMRKANAAYLFIAGMFVAAFVSIPILNLATPIFAMAFMVHVHKKLAGARVGTYRSTRADCQLFRSADRSPSWLCRGSVRRCRA